jgi:hypothetical protein
MDWGETQISQAPVGLESPTYVLRQLALGRHSSSFSSRSVFRSAAQPATRPITKRMLAKTPKAINGRYICAPEPLDGVVFDSERVRGEITSLLRTVWPFAITHGSSASAV